MCGTERASSPGDLGRRLAVRRAQLGLEVEQVAKEAGMDPSYLRHLESEPAVLASVSVLRALARALQTTPAALLGAAAFLPAGSGVPGGGSELHVLTEQRCWELLAPGGVGRVVFDSPRGPVALPVNFALLGRTVVFRTREDSEIANLAGSELAGFEVDRIDDAQRQGWSVMITGQVRNPREEELAQVESLGVTPWAAGDRHAYLLLEPAEVTGRRIGSEA